MLSSRDPPHDSAPSTRDLRRSESSARAQLFLADIGRDINPVIKVADYTEDELQNELEDYVVTDVIEKYLLDFLEHYTDTRQKQTDRVGVWISGYVGSGKSHFAKLLGLLVAPATKIAQLTNAPAGKLARVIQAYAKKGEAA